MQIANRLLFAVTLSAALLAVVMPTRTPAAMPHKVDCCANMNPAADQNDCGAGQAPSKSAQDRQCCSACAIGLSLFLATSQPFLFPPSAGDTLTSNSVREFKRTDRPLIPPPRSWRS
jgi:hypothetical protein